MIRDGDKGRRVLVVDADSRSLELIAVALIDSGFTVRTAVSAAEAVSEARRLPPALVLSDAEMPGTDGFELSAALRREPALDAIPIVLLTNRPAGPRDRERGATVGVADYLPKLVDLPGLVRMLQRLAA
ncbi:MAG: response regulator [Chloroflexota bacterium]|nr:response regulator [Chloroflexota bacterium]